MTEFIPDPSSFQALRDKVVVLTGGASGIGAATVTLLSTHGAHVVFGDLNRPAAEALVASLAAGVLFVPCDVTRYADLYRLFKTAHDTHGRVDHAFSCAGILERGNWFDPGLTIERVEGEEGRVEMEVLDVNLVGTLNFARIAVVFLREGGGGGGEGEGEGDKSLTLMSSVNAFRESPGLYMYQTSKHAVQGLMRSTHRTLHARDHIRVNCLCPGVTESGMTTPTKIIDTFKRAGLHWQTSEAVARMALGLLANPVWSGGGGTLEGKAMEGKAIYVEGGRGWEFEGGFYQEQPRWLGEEATRMMRRNAEAVNQGALLKK